MSLERMTWEQIERLGLLIHMHTWSAVREVQARSAGDFELAALFNDRTIGLDRAIQPLAELAALEIALYGEIAL